MRMLKAAFFRTTPMFRQPPRSTWTLGEHALMTAILACTTLALIMLSVGTYSHG